MKINRIIALRLAVLCASLFACSPKPPADATPAPTGEIVTPDCAEPARTSCAAGAIPRTGRRSISILITAGSDARQVGGAFDHAALLMNRSLEVRECV